MSSAYHFPTTTPEAQGISSSCILSLIESIEKSSLELHSFMLLRHGHIVAKGWWSPYGPEHPHMLFSLSKSFTSTAIGLAAYEGLLSLNDTVISFFPEYTPEAIGENLASMRVKHLLSMSTGHAEDTTGRLGEQADGNWVKEFLSIPVDYTPGTHFVYNSGASYMLSAIIQRVTGQTLIDYLSPRLFEPLGIIGATWESCPKGINTGGWGLSIKTEDIARFGQLYLQKGVWNDKRILPESWVEEATSFHISNGNDKDSDWAQGYGYQFWQCRHGIYRGDGAFGQYCIVMPRQDAVIAITSGLSDMQAVLNLIWEHLLPGMANNTLPEDGKAVSALENKLSSLSYLPPKLHHSSSTVSEVSGMRYELDENDMKFQAVSFSLRGHPSIFSLWDSRGEHRIYFDMEKWHESLTTLFDKPQPVAASGTWSDEHTLVITCRMIDTPFYETAVCHFDDDCVSIDLKINVSFTPDERPKLMGKKC